jgi:hypothetical protein
MEALGGLAEVGVSSAEPDSFFSAFAVILSNNCWMSISPLAISSYVLALGWVASVPDWGAVG